MQALVGSQATEVSPFKKCEPQVTVVYSGHSLKIKAFCTEGNVRSPPCHKPPIVPSHVLVQAKL